MQSDKKKMRNNGCLERMQNLIKADLANYGNTILLVIVILGFFELIFGQLCPMKILFGISCPGCGLTHACFYIATFRWKLAWQWNPTAFLWVPLIVFWFINRYILQKYGRWVQGGLIVTCIVTMIRYVIVIGQYGVMQNLYSLISG